MNATAKAEETQAYVDPNEKFLILSYEVDGHKFRVYLLNPGDWFQGFGGSSAGLVVGENLIPGKPKTASLIVRRIHGGWYDLEVDINNKDTWASIREGYAKSIITRTRP